MNINLIKTSFGLAAIASVIAMSGAARAADPVDLGNCATYDAAKPHVYVAGSSAIKPFITALATAVKDTQVVIYVKGGSCKGVEYALSGTDLDTGAKAGFVGPDNCTVPAGTKADIGVSDVFATSCAGFEDPALQDGFKDFQGPIQTMNFVVPKGAAASTVSISAEAAYLVFGFDPATNDPATNKSYANGTPWTSKDDIWIRGSSSGTQSMLAAAIKVPPAAWALNGYVDTNTAKHEVADAATMVNTVGGATNVNSTIGILASTELDDATGKVRGLAFQGYGQSCGIFPDAVAADKDKLNVRTGKYEIWGPLHMYAAVDNKGKPSQAVQDLVDYVNGTKAVSDADPLQLVGLEIQKNLVPACAMQVSRDGEIGVPMSVQPTCTCYYESQRFHGGQEFDGCKHCDVDGKCKNGLTCTYGFCEAL